MKVLKGVIHGRAIELAEDAGLPDGQEVTVAVQPAGDGPAPPGEGLRRAFGGWANDDPDGLDEYLDQVRRDRKIDRREIDP